jgi:hypothetical protein
MREKFHDSRRAGGRAGDARMPISLEYYVSANTETGYSNEIAGLQPFPLLVETGIARQVCCSGKVSIFNMQY